MPTRREQYAAKEHVTVTTQYCAAAPAKPTATHGILNFIDRSVSSKLTACVNECQGYIHRIKRKNQPRNSQKVKSERPNSQNFTKNVFRGTPKRSKIVKKKMDTQNLATTKVLERVFFARPVLQVLRIESSPQRPMLSRRQIYKNVPQQHFSILRYRPTTLGMELTSSRRRYLSVLQSLARETHAFWSCPRPHGIKATVYSSSGGRLFVVMVATVYSSGCYGGGRPSPFLSCM